MYWTGTFYYTHKDWLGSGRLNTTIPASGNGVLYYDRQFSPTEKCTATQVLPMD